jgi:hypothetical protein
MHRQTLTQTCRCKCIHSHRYTHISKHTYKDMYSHRRADIQDIEYKFKEIYLQTLTHTNMCTCKNVHSLILEHSRRSESKIKVSPGTRQVKERAPNFMKERATNFGVASSSTSTIA